MNLNEIQEILKNKLKTPERMTDSIIKILRVVKHQQYGSKKEIIEIVERDCDE